MNKLFFSSSLMWNASPRKLIEMAASHHIAGIEVWAQQTDTRAMDLNALREAGEKAGIQFIVHAKSWDLNYASIEKRIRHASVQAVCESIDTAAALGAREVTVHPPRYTLKASDAARQRAYQSLKEIAGYADARKIEISMEIMEHLPKEMATTPAEMLQLIQDLPVSFTVDVAHCLTEQECFDNLKQLKNVSKLHISNKKGTRLHTPLNDGDFDFKELLPKLSSFDIPMVIEGYDDLEDYSVVQNNLTFAKNIFSVKEKNDEEKIISPVIGRCDVSRSRMCRV